MLAVPAKLRLWEMTDIRQRVEDEEQVYGDPNR